MSGYFVVTHNGYDTQYFDTPAEVEKFINDTLEAHKDLKPRQIFRANGEDNRTEEPLPHCAGCSLSAFKLKEVTA